MKVSRDAIVPSAKVDVEDRFLCNGGARRLLDLCM